MGDKSRGMICPICLADLLPKDVPGWSPTDRRREVKMLYWHIGYDECIVGESTPCLCGMEFVEDGCHEDVHRSTHLVDCWDEEHERLAELHRMVSI